MSDVISIRPQLLCGKLSRELGRYIESDPCASPAEMLELCNQIFSEIGAVQVDGVWTLCQQVGDVINCRCGKPSSHYGTMGIQGAREVREIAPQTNPGVNDV